MTYSPIAMFVYNRADHAKATFEALAKCPEAIESELYIFSDGAKNEASKKKVDEVREYLQTIASSSRFKKVTVIESPTNKGLAASIIQGVTEIVSKYGKIIVIEDDCKASPHLLNYMNLCLEKYDGDKEIGSIAGYAPRLSLPKNYLNDIFLATRSCSWGWATWKDRWNAVDWELRDFKDLYKKPEYIKRLNSNGNDRFIRLYRQTKGNGSSWSVRFGAYHAMNNLLVIYPRYSYIQNIGCDETGTHSKGNDAGKIAVDLTKSIQNPNIDKPKMSVQIQKEMYRFYSGNIFSRIKRCLATQIILRKK